jgi:hypothetical protein
LPAWLLHVATIRVVWLLTVGAFSISPLLATHLGQQPF